MNGAGNDFIMLDNREGHLTLNHTHIAHLCDRHRGIGADGLLILEKPSSTHAAARMCYYNADGHEAEMCGNGARCFTRYVAGLWKQTTGSITFETAAGILEGELLEDQVQISMSDPHTIALHEVVGDYKEVHSINTGVPHVVLFVDDLEHAPVIEMGRALRHHVSFAPAGTNVNFVQIIAPNHLAIRTFERGVEDETLACGTGVVASALIHHLLSKVASPVSVTVRGRETLEVAFVSALLTTHDLPKINQVTLTGPAEFVFEGTIYIHG
ncbi:MAG: diaminopimelate epimerase [Chthoniobacterales bacterium]